MTEVAKRGGGLRYALSRIEKNYKGYAGKDLVFKELQQNSGMDLTPPYGLQLQLDFRLRYYAPRMSRLMTKSHFS